MRSLILAFALLGTFREVVAADLIALEGLTQGTSYHVKYVGPERPGLQTKLEAELARFDRIYSNYRPDSTISRFNSSPTLEWFPVEPELAALIHTAGTISEATLGTFDITAGEVSRIWGFPPFSFEKNRLPNEAEIKGALSRSGYRRLEVQTNPPSIRRLVGGLKVDLSGIAQGHAVDQLAKVLNSEGLTAYTVEIGGELYTRGQKPDGSPWRIALEAPEEDGDGVAGIIPLSNAALSTSGTYRSSLVKEGRSYAHIMDLRQGRPVHVPTVSASVIASNCRDADAFAKAFLMLDTRTLQTIAARFQLSALLMTGSSKVPVQKRIGSFPRVENRR